MFTSKNSIISAICLVLVTACGGGGGSSSSSDVSLGGSFSKGLYANAEVQAYEVINGALVPIGTKTTTNASGEYTLTLKPTSNPVVVEMTTTASTTMLDETAGFAAVNPKVGTKMRTMVGDLTESAPAVHGNLFTEMAVAGAQGATGGLTAASAAASKALIQSATGIDPFSVKPVGSTSASMDSNQEKLMTLLTAMMVEAKANAGSCAGDSTGVSCLVTTLNSKAAITSNSGAGTYSVTDAAGLNTYLTAKTNALSTYTPAGGDAGGFIAKMKSNASVVAATMAVPTAISATDASNRQGLDKFLQAMRSGFNDADATIKARNEAAKVRLDKFVFDHVGDGLKVLGDAMDACSTTSGTLVCTTGGTSIFTAASSGYTFTYDVTINGLLAATSATTHRIAGTVSASLNSDTGAASATIAATKTKISDSSKMSEINLVFSGNGIKKDSLSGSVSLSAFTIKAYDQTASSTKWAQLSLTGSSLSASRPSVGGLGTITLVAPLTFTTSDGDLVSGKINSLIGQEKVTNLPYNGSKDMYPTSVNLSLDLAVKEGALLGLSLVASQNIDAYNPDLPSSATNQENGSVLLKFKLADNVSADLTATKSTYDKTNFDMKITSNGNWIDLAGKTKRTNLAVNNETLDGDIVVTSSGPYTANLRKSSGRVQGEILKSGQQIGVVVDDVIKVGGVEVSIR